MNKEEANEVLLSIFELYPDKFQLTERKIALLIPKLLEMDYEQVMDKLSDFAMRSPFPPTLAEIAAYKPKDNEYLNKMQQWDEDAAKVPEDIKRQFKEQLEKLVEVKMK